MDIQQLSKIDEKLTVLEIDGKVLIAHTIVYDINAKNQ